MAALRLSPLAPKYATAPEAALGLLVTDLAAPNGIALRFERCVQIDFSDRGASRLRVRHMSAHSFVIQPR
jgi:hypothetical protein